MLRIYTKLPLYLSIVLSFFLNIEAQAEAWSQSSCRARCTANICQNNPDIKKLCQIKCQPTQIHETCRDMHQGISPIERLNGENENNNDDQPIPQPPSDAPSPTIYKQAATDGSYIPMTEEIPQRAQALEGKILKEASVPKIPGMVKKKGIIMENDTPILTNYGILMVLKKMGKINSNFDLKNISYEVIPFGHQIEVKERYLEGEEIYEEVIAIFTRGRTGTFSNQIFFVTIADKLLPTPDAPRNFVIKGVDWADRTPPNKIKSRMEPTPVKELQDIARVKQIIVPKLQEATKSVILPELHTSEDIGYYFDKKGNKNYIAIFETAQGEALFNLTHSFLNSINSGNTDTSLSDKWNEIMEEVGAALGKLHWVLASPEDQKNFLKDLNLAEFKTVVHGDFHFGNIFYDDARPSNKVAFIDVATMADSIYEPAPAAKDLYAFYVVTKYFHSFLDNLGVEGIKLFNEGYRHFAYGYAMAVAPAEQAERAKLQDIIYNQFKQWTGLVQNHYNDFMNSYQAWISQNVPPSVKDGDLYTDPINMMVEKVSRISTLSKPYIVNKVLQDPINSND